MNSKNSRKEVSLSKNFTGEVQSAENSCKEGGKIDEKEVLGIGDGDGQVERISVFGFNFAVWLDKVDFWRGDENLAA